MLKKHSQLFEGLFMAADLIVVSFAWILSYWLRFSSGWFEIEKGIPPFVDYVRMLLFVWLIWAFVFRKFGLYRPMRGMSRWREIWMVVKANAFAVLLLVAVTYLFREKSVPFSRLVFVIFLVLSTVSGMVARIAIRSFLRFMRKRGHNLRFALIVGAGSLAQKVASRMVAHPEFGIELLGCLENGLDNKVNGNGQYAAWMGNGSSFNTLEFVGNAARLRSSHCLPVPIENGRVIQVPILGSYEMLPHFLDDGRIDQVIVALPLSDHGQMETVINSIGDSMVDVRIVPDLHQFIKLGSAIEEFDGLPVVSIASTPLVGVNRIFKRSLDLVFGTLFLIFALPIMIVAALLVKLTSRGPIFYSQERVGLDGQSFNIYKFRTMYIDAERQGARFAVNNDPRVTPVGKALRYLSIDELPQLVNVIFGHMSLVGPRPERPVFIEDFRRRIPGYMLRHKVQAGMTGWAQVNGWRGNTSIERRIEHDLYYIENWSLVLDIKIIGLTLFGNFRDRNAY